ncbi:MFS transporter [Atopobacter phocae]|uniref:MFS transporter n=1 Tax=Atopobacter phocae TaxID=136492 RepID=UPI0004B3FA78
MIFGILVLFWSTLSIIRAYRKLYALTPIDQGGLALTAELAAQVTAGYGLMSLFARLPMFIISDRLNRRKIFIQIALFLLMCTSFAVFWQANVWTLYASSLAMGLSATMLAMFNIIFSETFSKDQAIVSVSILSVAPLLAEFIAAPIQYLMTNDIVKHFNWMWLISAVLATITLILTFQMKDYIPSDQEAFSIKKVKIVLQHKSFLAICVLAILISFIKFSTSGANMVAYGKLELNMSPVMLAYLDTVFAVPQLIAGVLAGIYFVKRIGVKYTLMLAMACAGAFMLIALYVRNPWLVFIGYTLNGFSYGLVYNVLISMAMQYFDRTYRSVSMGIYQAFFALGIFYGDYVYVWIAQHIPNGLFHFTHNQSIFVVTFCLTVYSNFMIYRMIK